jgi:hypothetical protein
LAWVSDFWFIMAARVDDASCDLDTRVVEEMGIWAGSVRVDIAVINGEFHGFELKSDRDTGPGP